MDAWIDCPTCGGNGGRECAACLGAGGFEVRPALPANCAHVRAPRAKTDPRHDPPCETCNGDGERAELPKWTHGDAYLERQLVPLLLWSTTNAPPLWDLLLALGLVAMRPWTPEEKKGLKASMQERGYTHCPRIDAMQAIARKIKPELLTMAEAMCENVAVRLRLDLGNLLRVRGKLSARSFWAADWHDLCRRREDLACVLRIIQLGQGRAWFPPSLPDLDREAEAVDQDGIEVNKKQRKTRERVPFGWWGL